MSHGQMNLNKEKIISLVMNNQNILKCLYYQDNNSNILNSPNLTARQKIEVRNKNIYKYRKIPNDTEIIQHTYISMEYGEIYYMGTRRDYGGNPYFKLPDFIFYIVSHSSLDENKLIGSRIDRIEEEIYDIFHDEITIDDFGKSYLVESKPLYLPGDYLGRQVTIRFVGRNN